MIALGVFGLIGLGATVLCQRPIPYQHQSLEGSAGGDGAHPAVRPRGKLERPGQPCRLHVPYVPCRGPCPTRTVAPRPTCDDQLTREAWTGGEPS